MRRAEFGSYGVACAVLFAAVGAFGCSSSSSGADTSSNGAGAAAGAGGGAATGGASGTAGTSATGGTSTAGGAGGTSDQGGAAGTSTTGGSAGTSTTGGSGGASTGGTGGSGGAAPNGQPITAPDNTWTWIDFPDSQCRDGSNTGIGVSMNSASSKVMIYLEGGGACFNQLTCVQNPSTFGKSDFGGGPNQGIFDRTNAANPVKDWNLVYVPYCTGDVHAGNNPMGFVKTAGNQVFVGYQNIGAYLNRLVPTFASASQILLTGASAGGVGAAANYQRTQEAFGSIRVDLVDDSGPPMSTDYLASCLQSQLVTMWGLDKTILPDCGSSCTPDNFFLPFAQEIAAKYPDRRLGLIESTQDATIRQFYGFGLSSSATMPDMLDCTVKGIPSMPASMFTAGLDDLRTELAADTNFGSFYFNSTDHTSITQSLFYTRAASDGTKLVDWVGAIANGTISNVGP